MDLDALKNLNVKDFLEKIFTILGGDSYFFIWSKFKRFINSLLLQIKLFNYKSNNMRENFETKTIRPYFKTEFT